MEEIRNELHVFLKNHGRFPQSDPDAQLRIDIFENAVIDSLGAVQLIAHIESRYGIELGPDIFDDPRFNTIQGIAEILAERKRQDEHSDR